MALRQMGHSLIRSPHSWQVPWPHMKIMFFSRSRHTGHIVCSLMSCSCCCSFCTSALTLMLSLSLCRAGMLPLAVWTQGTLRENKGIQLPAERLNTLKRLRRRAKSNVTSASCKLYRRWN